MPQIHNIKLHSFSSEDPNFPAKNLTTTNVTKKWKCEKAGEKSAYVVLKLDQPYTITQIDIGNEFSGIVEILVGNSQQDPPKYTEILLATSLMTISEARNENNPNRMRMFSKEVFMPNVADKKWDLIKVTCTQPHTNRKQYGIAFINIFTNDEVKASNEDKSPVRATQHVANSSNTSFSSSNKHGKACGNFFFRNSSDSDDDDKNTSPFAKWKNKKASIKEDLKEKLAAENTRKRSREEETEEQPKKDRNRSKGLMYDSDDDAPNEKLQKKMDKDKELKEKEKHIPKFSNLSASSIAAATASSPKLDKFSSFIGESSSKKLSNTISSPNNRVKAESEKPKPSVKLPEKPTKSIQYKPFGKLLEGVSFVISGYQNPERGVIRQKALDMGARYKADWDGTCTHLVCSYSNTPKYNQVKGKGKIISKKWIESCFTEQKRLPWRRFALDSSEKDEPESEDEIHCEWHKKKANNSESEMNIDSDDDDDDMLIVDKRSEAKKSPLKPRHSPNVKLIVDSDSDGDMKVVNKSLNDIKKVDDPVVENYSEDSVSSIDITQVECEAFKGKKFYLNADLSATDKIVLADHIKQMLGAVTKNPHKADYIIAKLGKSLPINAKAEVVKDTWIRECFELKAFIPTSRYKIITQS